jgi:hypothetical protein
LKRINRLIVVGGLVLEKYLFLSFHSTFDYIFQVRDPSRYAFEQILQTVQCFVGHVAARQPLHDSASIRSKQRPFLRITEQVGFLYGVLRVSTLLEKSQPGRVGERE